MTMATYLPYKGSEGRPAYLRDASFSSYLDTSERDFIRNLPASIHSQEYSPARHISPSRVNMRENRFSRNDGLDVFGAERYFSEKLDDQKSPIHSKNRGVRSKHKDTRETRDDPLEKSSFSKSSTSSQFGGLNLLFGLQYKGACFDKKSVCTTNTTTQKTTQIPKVCKGDKSRNRKSKVSHQEHFSFPIILTNSYNHLDDDQPRKSLEVFGFHHIAKQDLERQLLNLTQHDSFPFPSTKIISPSYSRNVDDEHGEYDDARSDASSDLFEIENLSGIPTSQTSYATSEASIESSVNVTASAAELFNVISDRPNDQNYWTNNPSDACKKVTIKESVKVQAVQQKSSSSGGRLLGCKGHKSVDVVGSFKNKNSIITKKSNA